MILTGKQQFRLESNRNKAGRVFKLNLGGVTHLPGGSSFYLGGTAFQRGRYWGCAIDSLYILCL